MGAAIRAETRRRAWLHFAVPTLAAHLGACEPPIEAPPVAAAPVVCGADLDLFSFSDPVAGDAETRELAAVVDDVPGEITLAFVDAGSVRFVVDQGAAPLLPEPGLVRIIPWSGDCWGEGCDPRFHIFESEAIGRFLEIGSLNALNGGPIMFGPRESPLSFRYGAEEDACPAGGGEVPAVLRAADDAGPTDVLPGQNANVVVDGRSWHVAAGDSQRTEFIQTNADCADCAPPGRHTDTVVHALLYRHVSP